MNQFLLSLSLFFVLTAQDSLKNIFYESDDLLSSSELEYPDFIATIGMGYLFHKNNDVLKISYSNGPTLNLEFSKYFFQGTYLTVSTIFSKTIIDDARFDPKRSTKYDYFSYYIGINYFSRLEKKFSSPWYFGIGFGSNQFYSHINNSGRFSVELQLGKVTNTDILGGNLSFSARLLLNEEIGLISDPYGYYAPARRKIIYTSLLLNVSLTFNFSNI